MNDSSLRLVESSLSGDRADFISSIQALSTLCRVSKSQSSHIALKISSWLERVTEVVESGNNQRIVERVAEVCTQIASCMPFGNSSAGSTKKLAKSLDALKGKVAVRSQQVSRLELPKLEEKKRPDVSSNSGGVRGLYGRYSGPPALEKPTGEKRLPVFEGITTNSHGLYDPYSRPPVFRKPAGEKRLSVFAQLAEGGSIKL